MFARLILITALTSSFAIASDPSTPPVKAALAKNPKAPLASTEARTRATPWRISAGGQWRQLGEASFHNLSRGADFSLSALSKNSGHGPDGIYRDGYVLPDISGSTTDTWNWGFDAMSQVQSGGIAMHGTNIVLETASRSFDRDYDERASGFGGFIKLESPEILRWRGFSLTGIASYGYTRADIDHTGLVFSATQTTTSQSVTDLFGLNGSPPPSSPVHGTSAGPGPIIGFAYTRSIDHRRVIDSLMLDTFIRNQLAVNMHTLSLGPQLNFDARRFRLTSSFGLALNLADWETRTDETVRARGATLAHWHSSDSGTNLLAGCFFEAGCEYALTPRLSLTTAGRYDWAGTLRGHSSTSSFDLDLNGWAVLVGFSYKL